MRTSSHFYVSGWYGRCVRFNNHLYTRVSVGQTPKTRATRVHGPTSAPHDPRIGAPWFCPKQLNGK
jgi:hypothetical protein